MAEIPAGTVQIRGLAVTALVGAAAVVVLREARPVLVPVSVSILLAYALEPIVAALVRRHVPRILAAALVYVAVAAALATGSRGLERQVATFLDDLPRTVAALGDALGPHGADTTGLIDRLRRARGSLERNATSSPSRPPGARRVTRVGPAFDVRPYLFQASRHAVRLTTQLLAIFLLTFLLLSTGDMYKRKLLRIGGSTLAERRITLEVVGNIDRQIERYLVARLMISGLVAAATMAVLELLGVDHAGALGLAAGALNVVPFIGPGIAVTLASLAALLQFRTFGMAGAAGGGALIIAAIEGNILTPLLMGRAGALNTVAVFVSVLVWGWLWDVWGLVLAIPMTVAAKAAADHIESLKPIGELLGR